MDKSVVQPVIKELKKTQTPKSPDAPRTPPRPSELDQDAGGGYNSDHTYPQT